MRFLQDPANRDAALAIYERRMQVERPAAEGAYALLLGQRSNGREGLNRDGRIDIEGVRKVLELRGRYVFQRRRSASRRAMSTSAGWRRR